MYLFLKTRSADKSIRLIMREALKIQETCVLWFGPKLVVAVVNPEDVKVVLTECLEKADVYHDIGFNHALLYSKVIKWKPHRRILNSSFNIHRVTSLFENMTKISNDFIIRVEKFCNKKALNVFPLMLDVSSNLTLMAHFNETYSQEDISIIGPDIENTFKNIYRKMVEYFVCYPLYYIKQALSIDLISYGLSKSICTKILKDKYKLYSETILDDDAEGKLISEEDIRKHPDNFIKRIFRMLHYKYLTLDESIDHSVIVLTAGIDTTAITLSNITLLIAMHEDIQDNLYNEIKTILNDSDEENNVLSLERLNEFQYVDRVIKESLRLLPVIALFARKPQKDIQLENGIIPAGTETLILAYSIHRNQKYWGPDADKFNPDNFLPENVEKRHRCSYIPFSYGNRNCIASQYAQVFLKFMIIKLFHKYKFTTELKFEDIKLKYELTSKVSSGYLMEIEKR